MAGLVLDKHGMASPATLYRFKISLSDVERSLYEGDSTFAWLCILRKVSLFCSRGFWRLR